MSIIIVFFLFLLQHQHANSIVIAFCCFSSIVIKTISNSIRNGKSIGKRANSFTDNNIHSHKWMLCTTFSYISHGSRWHNSNSIHVLHMYLDKLYLDEVCENYSNFEYSVSSVPFGPVLYCIQCQHHESINESFCNKRNT